MYCTTIIAIGKKNIYIYIIRKEKKKNSKCSARLEIISVNECAENKRNEWKCVDNALIFHRFFSQLLLVTVLDKTLNIFGTSECTNLVNIV